MNTVYIRFQPALAIFYGMMTVLRVHTPPAFHAPQLNEHLSSRTFLVGSHSPTLADLVIYGVTLPATVRPPPQIHTHIHSHFQLCECMYIHTMVKVMLKHTHTLTLSAVVSPPRKSHAEAHTYTHTSALVAVVRR